MCINCPARSQAKLINLKVKLLCFLNVFSIILLYYAFSKLIKVCP